MTWSPAGSACSTPHARRRWPRSSPTSSAPTTAWPAGPVRTRSASSADGRDVIVDFRRPSAYFPSVAASPTLAVLPPAAIAAFDGSRAAEDLVVSGAYRPTAADARLASRLEANPRYWAGEPPLGTHRDRQRPGRADPSSRPSRPATSTTGASPTSTPAGSPMTRRSARSSAVTPSRRSTSTASTRRGRRSTTCASARPSPRPSTGGGSSALPTPDAIPATSLVPPGIPGRGDADVLPAYDPDGARRLLAEAGYPGGKGFPETAIVTQGYAWDGPVARQIEDVLGIRLRQEVDALRRVLPASRGVATARPSGPCPGSPTIPRRRTSWASSCSRAAPTTTAAGATRPTTPRSTLPPRPTTRPSRRAATPRPRPSCATQVPVIPMAYHEGWALGRDDLAGTQVSGLGILRFASLDRVGR